MTTTKKPAAKPATKTATKPATKKLTVSNLANIKAGALAGDGERLLPTKGEATDKSYKVDHYSKSSTASTSR